MSICKLLVVLFVLCSCQDRNSTNSIVKKAESAQADIKPIESNKTYRFIVNNNKENEFGFIEENGDESIGVRGIAMDHEYIFLSDPVHGNIKRIDIEEGVLLTSKKLTSNKKIRQVTIFNDLVFLITDSDTCYILTKSLELKSQLVINDYRWVKDVFSKSDKKLILYRPIEDVNQDETGQIQMNVVEISATGDINKRSLSWSYKDFEKTPYSSRNSHFEGWHYEVHDNVFKNQFGKFEIKGIPNTFKYYDSKNICFDKNRIAYFEVTSQYVTAVINFYK